MAGRRDGGGPGGTAGTPKFLWSLSAHIPQPQDRSSGKKPLKAVLEGNAPECHGRSHGRAARPCINPSHCLTARAGPQSSPREALILSIHILNLLRLKCKWCAMGVPHRTARTAGEGGGVHPPRWPSPHPRGCWYPQALGHTQPTQPGLWEPGRTPRHTATSFSKKLKNYFTFSCGSPAWGWRHRHSSLQTRTSVMNPAAAFWGLCNKTRICLSIPHCITCRSSPQPSCFSLVFC